LIHNNTPLDLPVIQEHITKKRKQLNELGLLYDKRNQLNPLRWGVKPRFTQIRTHFSHLKEQVKGLI